MIVFLRQCFFFSQAYIHGIFFLEQDPNKYMSKQGEIGSEDNGEEKENYILSQIM